MRATEELTAELEILNAEKQEAESVIASVGAEIADAREEVEESKKHLDEINEQIADREKRYAVYEKKIDKVLAAGKPVAFPLFLEVSHQSKFLRKISTVLLIWRRHQGLWKN